MLDRASLNLATIGPGNFEDRLHAAFAADFAAVGLLRTEMEKEGEAGLEELRMSQLAVSELVGVTGWMDEDRTARMVAMAQAEETFELATRAGCLLVIAYPTEESTDTPAAARSFRELCGLAARQGRRVGLEFTGDHPQVKDLETAWGIVDAAEAENGGVVIDTFHFWWGESTLAMLEAVPAEKVFLVQVSDCLEMPRRQVHNGHRVYPGMGAVPLEPLLAALRGKGYSGYYSLELQNEDYWRENPVTVAREGLRAMRRLDIT